MADGSDGDGAEPVLPPEGAEVRLAVEDAAQALGEDPEVVEEAFRTAEVEPEEVASALAGEGAQETVASLAGSLGRSEASVAVALADALEIREDDMVNLARELDADPGDMAEEIRRVHLEDLLQEIDVAGWLPWEPQDEPPSLEAVVAAARRAERRIVSGGLFLAALLVALGFVMFNAPPALRQVIWVILGVLLVVSGLGLLLGLLQLSSLTDRYLARVESVSQEFEGNSISVVAEMAKETTLGRRAREAALRRAWRLFREARARREADAAGTPGEEAPAGLEGDGDEGEDPAAEAQAEAGSG